MEVIFSIFGRKEAAARRRGGESSTMPGGPADGGITATAATTMPDQREIARRTAAKIDLIESQMNMAQTPAPSTAARRLALDSSEDATASWLLDDLSDAPPDDVLHFGLLPVFQEAAVLYSNGQSDEAVAILWQAIKEDRLGQHIRHAWTMLFEIYQATGRKPEFESLAIVYASRSESSPPTWSDDLAPPMTGSVLALASSTILFPVKLGVAAAKQVDQMRRVAARGRAAVVDFSKVMSVDAVGAGLLLGVLVEFRQKRWQLTLSGATELAAALSPSIESGRRDSTDVCWLLMLETLRILGLQQRFEDLAIDYCMTYEVSPPSWEALPASMHLRGPEPANGDAQGADANAPLSACCGLDGAFALKGVLDGRPEAIVKALREYAKARKEIVIDCRRLRRMDFAGAGEMLNESSAIRGAGKSLVFKDLNCLVACLMMVMGVHELADLNLRTR